MRGASAPPMSPPLFSRLPCIQIHPPNTNQKHRGMMGHGKVEGRFELHTGFCVCVCGVQLSPKLAVLCEPRRRISWHLGERTHLCAPDDRVSLRNMDLLTAAHTLNISSFSALIFPSEFWALTAGTWSCSADYTNCFSLSFRAMKRA